jgi:hypothetical protein
MYKVVINGLAFECETPEEVFRLANGAAASNGATQRPLPAQPAQPAVASPLVSTQPSMGSQVTPVVIADAAQSKWTGPAKTIIALLVQAGADGVDTDRIAETAGLAGPKGSAPLLKAVIALLGVGDNAIERSRTAEGKRRWVLKSRARKSAVQLGLLPNGEASRP